MVPQQNNSRAGFEIMLLFKIRKTYRAGYFLFLNEYKTIMLLMKNFL